MTRSSTIRVSHLRSEAGFTIVELLVSSLIMVVVTGAIFALMNPAQGAFQVQPEVSDLQQRLRVGVDTLQKDLVMAGAGTYNGRLAGALTFYIAPIMPYRGFAAPNWSNCRRVVDPRQAPADLRVLSPKQRFPIVRCGALVKLSHQSLSAGQPGCRISCIPASRSPSPRKGPRGLAVRRQLADRVSPPATARGPRAASTPLDP